MAIRVKVFNPLAKVTKVIQNMKNTGGVTGEAVGSLPDSFFSDFIESVEAYGNENNADYGC
jgi:hypothetical protein